MRGRLPVRQILALGAALVCLATGGLVARTVSMDAPQRMNVLLIVTDDLNTDLGSYGTPDVLTPNIDRLARSGVRFDCAFSQFPRCNPSRTSFLSGRRPETTGVLDNMTHPRVRLGDTPFLPEHFDAAGYFTGRVGKIAHTKFARSIPWDVSENAARDDPDGEGTGVGRIRWMESASPEQVLPDGMTAARAVRLLEEHSDRPFFLAVGFRKPHLPFIAPRDYFDLYPASSIELPQAPPDDTADVPDIAVRRNPANDTMTAAERRMGIAAYYACVSFVDAQVGVLLSTLDQLGLTDRTVVVFLSDHGFMLDEHGGLWGKNMLFEECVRVPLIVSAPGAQAGATTRQIVELVDLYQTLAELCGLPAPEGAEGTSFAPLLRDPTLEWKTAAFSAVVRRGNALGRRARTARYSYTEWDTPAQAELYDLAEDPHEFVNLATDSRYADVLAEMRGVLAGGWRAAQPRPSP
jgi:uncharacterized sulfatase